MSNSEGLEIAYEKRGECEQFTSGFRESVS